MSASETSAALNSARCCLSVPFLNDSFNLSLKITLASRSIDFPFLSACFSNALDIIGPAKYINAQKLPSLITYPKKSCGFLA